MHRLVAEAFVSNPDKLPEVNHIDSDPNNAAASNLEVESTLSKIKFTLLNTVARNES